MAVGGDSADEGGCTLRVAQPLQVLDAGLVVLIDRYLACQRCPGKKQWFRPRQL